MDSTTLKLYVQKLNDLKPKYITGYAHALYLLGQYLCESQELEVDIQAVFLDSEGIPEHFVPVIEKGLHTKVYRTYGLGEVGLVAVQAFDGRYHLLDLSCVVEIVDEEGKRLPSGKSGRLIVTDLTQTAVPYIRYDTGDIGCLVDSPTEEIMNTPILDAIDGRSDDIITTPAGRRVGRLSHVTKPGRGILESQIAQIATDQVVIRVVPTSKFDAASMEEVIEVARSLLGSEMQVGWQLVEAIPRTSRHKFKHVVREF